MPRHTHPSANHKHSRARLRHQRDRVIARNWQRAKDRYANLAGPHPDDARRDPTLAGAYWPFTLPRGEMARNPFNRCSCWMCSYRPQSRTRRHRERQAWQALIDTELAARRSAEPADPGVRWRYSPALTTRPEW